MEWFGREVDDKPTSWSHVHADDNKTHQHSISESCFKGAKTTEAWPRLTDSGDVTMVEVKRESTNAWAYLEDGCVVSIPNEVEAVIIAEEFPNTICFFADIVEHPNA